MERNETPEAEQVSGSSETPEIAEWLNTKCVFCKQELKENNEPRLLPCLHGACKACISAESVPSPASFSNYSSPATKPVTCPVCKEEINPDVSIEHLFILENLAHESEDRKGPCCTNCEESALASGFCTDCQEWLCEVCVQAHQRVRVTKDHSIRPRNEMEGEKTTGLGQKYHFCPLHSKEPLKLYCESCDKLTCRDCQLLEHKDHKYQFLSSACEQHRSYLATLLSKIKEKYSYIENVQTLISQRQNELTDREKEVTQEIKMFAIKFITEINRRGKQLLQELNEVCSHKKRQLTVKNEELVSFCQRLQHCQKFAEAVVNKGSDIALVYSKKAISEQLQHILRRRCEVPNSQHIVDIKFAYESEFLSDYISKIGCLLVDRQPIGGLGTGQQTLNSSMMTGIPPLSQHRAMLSSQVARPPPPYANIGGTGMTLGPRVPIMTQSHAKGYPQQLVSSSTHPNLAGHSPVQLRNILNTVHHQVMPSRPSQSAANWQQCMPGSQIRSPTSPVGQQARAYQVQMRPSNHQSPLSTSQASVAISLPVSLNSNITISPVNVADPSSRQSQAPIQRLLAPQPQPKSTPNLPPGLQILPHPVPHHSVPSPMIAVNNGPSHLSYIRNMTNTTRLSHFPTSSIVSRIPQENLLHATPMMQRIPNAVNVSAQPYLVPGPPINSVSNIVHRATPDSVSLTPPATTTQKFERKAGSAVHIKEEPKSSVDQLPSCSGRGHPPKEESIVDAASRILSEFAHQSIGSILKDGVKGTRERESAGEKKCSQTDRKEETQTGSHLAADSSGSPAPTAAIEEGSDGRELDKKVMVEDSRRDESRLELQETCRRGSEDSSEASENNLAMKLKKGKLDETMLPIVKIKKEIIDCNSKEMNRERQDSEDSNRSLLDDIQSLENLLKNSHTTLPIDVGQLQKNIMDKIEQEPSKKSTFSGREEKIMKDGEKSSNDDPNEDWCAVCHDGGELLCCSNCPRVFHLNCHVPAILTTPDEDWACLMCTDVINGPFPRESSGAKRKNPVGLYGHELLYCERILLELFCHEASPPFHEPVSKTDIPHYYKVISKPMDLLTIKKKLSPSYFNRYEDVEEFISDVRLIFSNCFVFNPEGSSLHNAAKVLQNYFHDLLKKYLAEYTFDLVTTTQQPDSQNSDGEYSKLKRQCKTSDDDILEQC
ncbi:transcription intermediary factor 1-alpha-like isoform X2 [Tachypleus tridentatus]